jgi:hypothetical protein
MSVFKFHKLNGVGIERAQRVQNVFEKCLADLQEVCPESREFSITKTKLEEACFFAKKSVAIQPENQEVQ